MEGEEIAFCELEATKTGGDTEFVKFFSPPLTPLRKRDSAPKSNFLSVISGRLSNYFNPPAQA